MATLLPPVPYWVFCVFEPISTFAGLGYAVLNTDKFVAEQLPDVEVSALSPQGTLVAWQTGNLFGIMAMMAIAVLWSTSEVAVVKRYLVALLLGDIGHLWVFHQHLRATSSRCGSAAGVGKSRSRQADVTISWQGCCMVAYGDGGLCRRASVECVYVGEHWRDDISCGGPIGHAGGVVRCCRAAAFDETEGEVAQKEGAPFKRHISIYYITNE
ncbi:hypothetical protein TWF696_005344 [Orbilia brochopaga]|uniref:DUF7704 domain-containing protein n=1 Tax=Orbilia brochopaga TaxID=3140254 RepID=A0AAV9V0N3_9PEZI